MEPICIQTVELTEHHLDRYGRLKPSMLLYMIQEVACRHCEELAVDYESLLQQRLFWAVTRHRVQISRMPVRGDVLRIETWPMPTTKVAYPRSVVAYDAEGNECFRAISLWVLMDVDERCMVLPGRKEVIVNGTIRGNELSVPNGLVAKHLENHASRRVCYTDLDRNGHMNNTRYLDWVDDLLPSAFHKEHQSREFTVCYLSEALEGQELDLSWGYLEDGAIQVDARRPAGEKMERVFSARFLY